MPIFGSKAAASSPKASMTQLNEVSELLEKRKAHLQQKVATQQELAKKFVQMRNKKEAMICLKRRKLYEAEIEKLDGARLTIDQQLSAISGAVLNREVMLAISSALATLKQVNSEMDIDRVDDMMEDLREEIETANSLWDAMAQPIGQVFDDDLLLDELDQLMAGDDDEVRRAEDGTGIAEPPARPAVVATPLRRPVAVAHSAAAGRASQPAQQSAYQGLEDDEAEFEKLAAAMA